jgi:hypothetical protein
MLMTAIGYSSCGWEPIPGAVATATGAVVESKGTAAE